MLGLEARREQIDWVLEERYWNDLESDLSVFHRVDDWRTLDGPRFFRYAVRLPAYQGALAARLFAEEQDREERHRPPAAIGKGGGTRSKPVQVSEDVALAKLANEGWVTHKVAQPPV